jgi:WhiB family transcriptional regulator, redox-sensing transcriptional regulator
VKRLQQQYLEALEMTIAPERPTGQLVGTGWQADWAPLGSCSKTDPDALFVQGAAQQTAKVVCQRCPVIAECLADALDNRTEFGVWGGMTERERRALLKRRPNVQSWRRLLEAAKAEHEQKVSVAG